MNAVSRWILFALGLILFIGVLAVTVKDATPPKDVRVVKDYKAWQPETLEVAETLPVQDGGRIKPLATYAGFTMLRIYGARKMEIKPSEDAEAVTLKPLAWLMDILFRPQYAIEQPSFRIDDSAALGAIGVTVRGKRDRYSYAELEPGRDKLYELAESYNKIPKKERGPLERHVLDLAENFRSYEQLLGVFAMARNGIEMVPVDGLPASGGGQRASVSAVMQTATVIRQVLTEAEKNKTAIPPHVENLLQQVIAGANAGKHGMFLFPPKEPTDGHWLSPGERVMNVMTLTTRDVEGSVKDIEKIEEVSRAATGDEATFRGKLDELRADLVARAEARGEYRGIRLEAEYYRKNWFLYALVWFLLGTLLAIGMWMTRGSVAKWLGYGIWASTAAGWVYVMIAITKRCIIMQRPPVGNLYDTIIFIAAAVIALGAVVEFFTRRRLALGALPIAGVMLILLARLFEVGDGSDHMDPLIAVLRSNFWLTTHVITITLGYAGGLVCAMISIVYVLMRSLRLDGGDKSLRRSMTRAVYGMVCVTLFLSLVGTVLGGIWANDSWGRFWGWDPKENGALMIVLANLAILHARLGGYIKEWGIHFASIFMAAIVTFSWWHVNMLDTGLHNYGFTEGRSVIMLVYAVIGLILLFGFIAKMIEAANESAARTSAGVEKARLTSEPQA
ncbi:MAG: cytochrome c biogenesis protein CcsA [Akkermansiaceae bacterium]|jgi:ABC-type transport system involved in cytochrome c biogenesis permease subunit|nr:cytochrome c biogenesis protein CcsA [Akkermansiaceae bacterium]